MRMLYNFSSAKKSSISRIAETFVHKLCERINKKAGNVKKYPTIRKIHPVSPEKNRIRSPTLVKTKINKIIQRMKPHRKRRGRGGINLST